MKPLAGLSLGVALVALWTWPAEAGTESATVVSACGTPAITCVVGQPCPQTQDTTGKFCTESTCGVSPTVTYVPGQTFPILVDTNGKTCTN